MVRTNDSQELSRGGLWFEPTTLRNCLEGEGLWFEPTTQELFSVVGSVARTNDSQELSRGGGSVVRTHDSGIV